MNKFIIPLCCLLLQAFRGIPDFLHLLSFIKKQSALDLGKHPVDKNRTWFVLLPLFKEQNIYKETISYLLELYKENDAILVVITSTKETGTTSTYNLIQNELKNKTWRDGSRIMLLNEDNQHSSMATQLNFAIKTIRATVQEHSSSFFVVYNADSRPSRFSLNCFEKKIQEYSTATDFVIQQPCAFVKDIGVRSNFVDALSLYQTWFSIGHENRILKDYQQRTQATRVSDRNIASEFIDSPLGYCVGHGSSMKFSTLQKLGDYPEKYLTEDLTLGYFLSAKQIPLASVDALEIADVPFSFKSYIQQRSVWFWNYVGYIFCFSDKKIAHISIARRLGLLYIGLKRGLYWLFSSIIYILPLVLGVLYRDISIILLGVAGNLLFQLLPMLYLLDHLPSILKKQGFENFAENSKKTSKYKLLIIGTLLVFTDSLGPWITVVHSLWYLSDKRLPHKYKTQR